MTKGLSVSAALKDAGCVRTVWESIPSFKMGNVSLNDFITAYDATDAAEKEYAKKDVELTGVKDSRDDNARHLNDLVTRFRSGMRSVYGPDSAQYGQAGGTRARDRKPPRPRAKAATG
ncbi:MAG: hypothetical protein DMG13_34615 [Acidobacteria bacterium]|nr:MAG: hypothetical protein DMG13_34615 [Acidobacteriota bacterium]